MTPSLLVRIRLIRSMQSSTGWVFRLLPVDTHRQSLYRNRAASQQALSVLAGSGTMSSCRRATDVQRMFSRAAASLLREPPRVGSSFDGTGPRAVCYFRLARTIALPHSKVRDTSSSFQPSASLISSYIQSTRSPEPPDLRLLFSGCCRSHSWNALAVLT